MLFGEHLRSIFPFTALKLSVHENDTLACRAFFLFLILYFFKHANRSLIFWLYSFVCVSSLLFRLMRSL